MGDLFERIVTKKLPYKANELPREKVGEYILPCLTSSFRNQGLNYYVPKDGATVLKHVISLPSNSDVYRAYYQSNEFTILSDAYAIKWKEGNRAISPQQYLFFTICINKVTDLSVYSYKNKLGGWNVVKNKMILLPTRNKSIDFEFIDRFIAELEAERVAELEAERVAELEAYLVAAGLKDCFMTIDEESTLKHFYNGDIDYRLFSLGNGEDRLFDIVTTKHKFNANTVIFNGKYPYVARSSTNNGVRGYITEDIQFLNDGNTISFGQDTATMYYQKKPYFTGDKIKIMKYQQGELTPEIALYLITIMNKAFQTFQWGDSFNEKILKNIEIILPTTSSGQIDTDYMYYFIRGIMKQVIKEVVLFTDKKIQATKQCINENR